MAAKRIEVACKARGDGDMLLIARTDARRSEGGDGSSPRTLLDRLWDRHVVVPESAECPAILFIDLHLIHEVTSPQAFTVLKERGLRLRRPDLTLATIDHAVPTLPAIEGGTLPYATAAAAQQVATLQENCAKHSIRLLDLGDVRRGIVHVVGPEMGLT